MCEILELGTEFSMEPSTILNFWFSECEPSQWFKKNANFDNLIWNRFSKIIEDGTNGFPSNWGETLEGNLAKIIVLDQFSRNVYRNSSKAFEGDSHALELSLKCIQENFLDNAIEPWRHFMLIPMMHSECIIIQKKSLPLFKKFTNEKVYSYAKKHCNIISRFGRFPHRNKILDRLSTAKEIIFLKKLGSSF